MPLDHISFSVPVAKYDETVAFYEAFLAPLNYTTLMKYDAMPGLGEGAAGLGTDGHADFWIGRSSTAPDGAKSHIAFVARTRKQVQLCHEAALKKGATCNGPPGPREHYGPGYYGGFVLDPIGNNVEVVCRKMEAEEGA